MSSLPVNAKLAVVVAVESAGPLVIAVLGAVVSTGGGVGSVTVQLPVAGEASALPAASVARTENVWSPTASEL